VVWNQSKNGVLLGYWDKVMFFYAIFGRLRGFGEMFRGFEIV
jgi:hypothetical protein